MPNTMTTSGYLLTGPQGRDVLEEHADPRQKLIRLKTLLAEWLRMENIVTLVGAGASLGRGGLVLADLEEQVLRIAAQRCRQTGRESCLPILEQRSEGGEPRAQFEEWLSYLSNVSYLLTEATSPISSLEWGGAPPPPREDLIQLMTDIERCIYALCSLALPEPVNERTAHHALAAKLIARDAALGRSHLFTLNYDTLLEQAFDQLAIQYMDGFVGTVQRRFDPSCYGLDLYYPGDTREGRVRRYDKFAHLYKLHGSVNWRINATGRVVQSNYRSPEHFTAWQGMQPRAQAERLDTLFEGNREPIAILPTANKFVQTLDLPYAHLFRALHNRLNEAQTFLLILGYGFGDAHLNRIIDDAMNNPSLVLLVVDPRPGAATDDRLRLYQETGERAFLLAPDDRSGEVSLCGFDDFSQNLLPQIQWLDDFTRVRRIEKTLYAPPSPTPDDSEL